MTKGAILPQAKTVYANKSFIQRVYNINDAYGLSNVSIKYDIPIDEHMKKVVIFANMINRLSCKINFQYHTFQFQLEFEITNGSKTFISSSFRYQDDECSLQRSSENVNMNFFHIIQPIDKKSFHQSYTNLHHYFIHNMNKCYNDCFKYWYNADKEHMAKLQFNRKKFNKLEKKVNKIMHQYILPLTHKECIYFYGI